MYWTRIAKLFGLIGVATLACAPSAPATKVRVEPTVKPTTSSIAGHVDGIHNIHAPAPGLISGSAPERDADFAQLKELGVRTILSVDGTPPDVDGAHKHGLRYVHLPVGYHGVERARQLEIARAVRDLPGPVYVHCHHGKHRGPAATASAAVVLGLLTPQEGVSFLKQAGTSENYPGLYQCVASLEVAPSEIDQAANDFPEVAPLPDFVRAMADAQEAYDHLEEVRDAGWRVPANHPDLVPEAEASRLETIMRVLQSDPEREKHPADFGGLLKASWLSAQAFESSLKQSADHQVLSERLEAVRVSCRACHKVYRDHR